MLTFFFLQETSITLAGVHGRLGAGVRAHAVREHSIGFATV